MKGFWITSQSTKSSARVGELKTAHGIIETPVFMPVATQAVFKGGVDSQDTRDVKAPIILANTYHLFLRGAVEVIKKAGGLHKFMNWEQPILTDSGGFQVWSLGLGARQDQLSKIDDDGVTFKSHIDGRTHRLTPEDTIKIQQDLGADIIMAFDEATPDDASYAYTKEAMMRTHEWAQRCLTAARGENFSSAELPASSAGQTGPRAKNFASSPPAKQLLFGIIQGGRFKKLRQQSAKFISALPFDGIAIGGESIGYNMKRTAEILDYLAPLLPSNKPLYTMGLGFSPTDFFTAVAGGADMFDCVAPARLARHGNLYCRSAGVKNKHRLNLLNAQYKTDWKPVCDWCDCSTCQNYSRAYLRHLFKCEELTALRLATIHNLRFMLKVMEEIRGAIKSDTFIALARDWCR